MGIGREHLRAESERMPLAEIDQASCAGHLQAQRFFIRFVLTLKPRPFRFQTQESSFS